MINSARLNAIVTLAAACLAGCGSSPERASQSPEEKARQVGAEKKTEQFNINLTQTAHQASMGADEYLREEYRVGSGDMLEISVFQIEALNTKARVNARGQIMLPLLGRIEVGGKTPMEVETMIRDALAEDYIRDPQVSVFVGEYRSQQVAVGGAVSSPSVYSLRQPRTLLEVLAMAGGLDRAAGYTAHVQTTAPDPETGERVPSNLVVDLRQLVRNPASNRTLTLRGGDSVYVEEAGNVFVEGAVDSPGSYPMQGEMTLLKALTAAGGEKWEASGNSIRVFRNTQDGMKIIEADLGQIKEDPSNDVALQDGDIVAVGTSGFKKGIAGFWDGVTGVFSVGAGVAL